MRKNTCASSFQHLRHQRQRRSRGQKGSLDWARWRKTAPIESGQPKLNSGPNMRHLKALCPELDIAYGLAFDIRSSAVSVSVMILSPRQEGEPRRGPCLYPCDRLQGRRRQSTPVEFQTSWAQSRESATSRRLRWRAAGGSDISSKVVTIASNRHDK